MNLRKLLINTSSRTEIEEGLKKKYLKRIVEMFKRAVTLTTTFNVFDEIFHGIAQTSSISDNLHNFYEAFLTITQYYQHSQAGRGSLVARLLKDLGSSENMAFEFVLTKLPKLLGQTGKLTETALTKIKFDIANKDENNLAFCELKMKVYSGCSAGRIEFMEKFKKFVRLISENAEFRNVIKEGNIENIYLIGGVLFDIEGNPATTEKDEEWGICYNGLMRGKDDLKTLLTNKEISFSIDEEKQPETAFVIKFAKEDISVTIIAVYGDEVIKKLFIGKDEHDISYFKEQLKDMLYDDLWLGQIIALSERAVLDYNFKTKQGMVNFITAIQSNDTLVAEIQKFVSNRNEDTLKAVTQKVLCELRKSREDLLSKTPIPALAIMGSSVGKYTLEDYVADIIQFLSCPTVLKNLQIE